MSDPENGAVTITGTGVGDTATYTCNSGYEISGSDTRVCGPDGEWSGSAPTCEGKYNSANKLCLIKQDNRWYSQLQLSPLSHSQGCNKVVKIPQLYIQQWIEFNMSLVNPLPLLRPFNTYCAM